MTGLGKFCDRLICFKVNLKTIAPDSTKGREHEFFIPAWDSKGNLLENQTRVYFTVEAKTDNFSSEIITSNVIQLESISMKEKPADLKVSVMPFPQFYQEFDSPIFVVGSGVN